MKQIKYNKIIKTDASHKKETIKFFTKAKVCNGFKVKFPIMDETNTPGIIEIEYISIN